jgi:hypothetical protein
MTTSLNSPLYLLFLHGCFDPRPSAITLSTHFITGLGLRGRRWPGRFQDLGDFVVRIDLDTHLIALGDPHFLQDFGIRNWQRPLFSLPGLECDRLLGLINVDDSASVKGGCGVAGERRRAYQTEQTDGHSCDSGCHHLAPPKRRVWLLFRDNSDGPPYTAAALPAILLLTWRKWFAKDYKEKKQ